jgi:hypothetical protein
LISSGIRFSRHRYPPNRSGRSERQRQSSSRRNYAYVIGRVTYARGYPSHCVMIAGCSQRCEIRLMHSCLSLAM